MAMAEYPILEDEVSGRDAFDAERARELLNVQADPHNSDEPKGLHRRDPTRDSISMSPLIAEQHQLDLSPLEPLEENFATIEPS